jgi:hypothetical protein
MRILLPICLLLLLAQGAIQTSELLIEPGDRIVAHLVNTGGPKKFAMIFVSSDQKTVISFRNQMFNVIPDPTKTDFKAKEFEELRKFAEQLSRKEVPVFAYNNSAEWLWGVGNPCVLGSIILQEHFTAAAVMRSRTMG